MGVNNNGLTISLHLHFCLFPGPPGINPRMGGPRGPAMAMGPMGPGGPYGPGMRGPGPPSSMGPGGPPMSMGGGRPWTPNTSTVRLLIY